MTKTTPEILNDGIPKTSEFLPVFLNKLNKLSYFIVNESLSIG
jgi:hypothetical protein